jgi:glutamyl/glutaminyl-tRNA synthetase
MQSGQWPSVPRFFASAVTQRIFRFAPSPNGFLHRGHAFSALYNFRAAAAHRGRFLLRIEDIDRTRARPEFEAAIAEDRAWLGLGSIVWGCSIPPS